MQHLKLSPWWMQKAGHHSTLKPLSAAYPTETRLLQQRRAKHTHAKAEVKIRVTSKLAREVSLLKSFFY